MQDIKQVIVVRKDLNMRAGKMAAQVAHASMKVILDRCSKMELGNNDSYYYKFFIEAGSSFEQWITGNFKKIVVYVNSENELLELYEKAKKMNVMAALITDSGLTEFKGVPTNTAVAIGPDYSEKINDITGKLNLM